MPFAQVTPAASGSGTGTVTKVSSADTSIAVTNGTTHAVLQVATMDVLFTNEPPAADVPLNAQKITGLADGVASSDAATVGQLYGAPLAVVQYAPASLATYNVTNTTGLTALDTTHLTASFTVPASGNVLVHFAAFMISPPSHTIGLGVLNHSGGAQLGYTREMNGFNSICNLPSSWYLTGLTPGALQIDIAAGVTGGTGFVYAMGHTGAVVAADAGPALIYVVAA